MPLKFGTSGLRGLVSEMTDEEVRAAVTGFLLFVRERFNPPAGAQVALAGDLRPSTGRIMAAAAGAITEAGFRPLNLGRIPTPALVLEGLARGIPGVMVTGSHIPFDRNGIKFTRPDGEVMKSDEEPIMEKIARARSAGGAVSGGMRGCDLPPEDPSGGRAYISRYTEAFPPDLLSIDGEGLTVGLYEHSAVGSGLLSEILEGLGAKVLPFGRSDRFVPIDTEAVDEALLSIIEEGLIALPVLPSVVVSTDGDGDRPLVVSVSPSGRPRFHAGDLVGLVAARFFGAGAAAVPCSTNDAVDSVFEGRLVKTRIGSPYLVEAMNRLVGEGFERVVGWEANGGFMTASNIGRLSPLPTRDAAAPIIAVLAEAKSRDGDLAALFDELPPRFGLAGLLDGIDPAEGRAAVDYILSRRGDDLFGSGIMEIDGTDGARVRLDNGEVIHVRPSGNAPQLRVYVTANSPERARELLDGALSKNGLLARILNRDISKKGSSAK